MYNNTRRTGGPRRRNGRSIALMAALALLLTLAIGGTVAWLIDQTADVDNVFDTSKTTGDITEDFKGEVKKSIQVENTGDIPVFVRVMLVNSWVVPTDDANGNGGQLCGNHPSAVPVFTLGENWVKHTDGFYYYTQVVPVGGETTNLLGSEISLAKAEDGCLMQIEVLSSVIQADGVDGDNKAVKDAWGVDPSTLLG